MKYLRYERAQSLPAYMKLVAECTLELTQHGCFSKQPVVDRAGLTGVDGDIRWDYVVRMIEEQESTELIAMAPAFFKRHKKEVEALKPAAFMATGSGRKTAGYAIVSKQNGHFVVHRLKLKRAMATGLTASAQRTVEVGARAQIPSMLSESKRQRRQIAHRAA